MADKDAGAAPGWAAIDAALAQLYPGVEPSHYGTLFKWALGGPDPLDGISVYQRDDHWHFVSYGMSELYGKESSVRDESGWGFEFTFRPAIAEHETDPPMWAANFLQNLARYVFSSGNPFAPGHHVDLNGPICIAEPDTAICAITFVEDPELGTIESPHGRVRFLQVVGLTLEEYAMIERWDAKPLLNALAPHLPLLITDLTRQHLTQDPQIAATLEEGALRDGSSTGSLFVQNADWRAQKSKWGRKNGGTVLTFGASTAERIARVLMARLPYGRSLAIDGSEGGILLLPGDELTVTEAGDGYLELTLPGEVTTELAGVLRPLAGSHPLETTTDLTIEIVKSQIRDQAGNVVREIG